MGDGKSGHLLCYIKIHNPYQVFIGGEKKLLLSRIALKYHTSAIILAGVSTALYFLPL